MPGTTGCTARTHAARGAMWWHFGLIPTVRETSAKMAPPVGSLARREEPEYWRYSAPEQRCQRAEWQARARIGAWIVGMILMLAACGGGGDGSAPERDAAGGADTAVADVADTSAPMDASDSGRDAGDAEDAPVDDTQDEDTTPDAQLDTTDATDAAEAGDAVPPGDADAGPPPPPPWEFDEPALTDRPCDPATLACCAGEGRVMAAGEPCLVDAFRAVAPDQRGPIVEYRCADDRRQIEARYAWFGCHGERASCTLDEEHLVWDPAGWVSVQTCDLGCVDRPGASVECRRSEPVAPEEIEDRCWPGGPDEDRFEVGRRCAPESSPVGGQTGAFCHEDIAVTAFTHHCDWRGACVAGIVRRPEAEIDAENGPWAEPLRRMNNASRCGNRGDEGCVTVREAPPARHSGTVSPFSTLLPFAGSHAACGPAENPYLAPCSLDDPCCDPVSGRMRPYGYGCGEQVETDAPDLRCGRGETLIQTVRYERYCNADYRQNGCVEQEYAEYEHSGTCTSSSQCPSGWFCSCRCGSCAVTDCSPPNACEWIGGGFCDPDTGAGCPARTVCVTSPTTASFCELDWVPTTVREYGVREVVVEDCAGVGLDCGQSLSGPECVDWAVFCDEGLCCDTDARRIEPAGTECRLFGPTPRVYERCVDGDRAWERVERVRRCTGDSSGCGSFITVLERDECDDGEACYDFGEGLGCHPIGAACDPAGSCCEGYGVPQVGERCGRYEVLGTTCVAPGETGQYRQLRRYRVCDEALRCSADPDTAEERLVGTYYCPAGALCEDGDEGWVACEVPPPPPCTAGGCCRPDTGDPLPAGFECVDAEPIGEQFRCSSDGRRVERREEIPVCDGVSTECGTDTRYTSWTTVETCEAGALCRDTGDGGRACFENDGTCTEGSCCVDGRIATAGTFCDLSEPAAVASASRYCSGDEIRRRIRHWTCDGFYATCPRAEPWARTERTEFIERCDYGCDAVGSSVFCSSEPEGGGSGTTSPCGNTCLLGGICGSGKICSAANRCIPVGCASCPATCVYDAATCSVLGCEDDDGGSSGGDPGGCAGACSGVADVLLRNSFYPAGTYVSRMEVDYAWSALGEPILNLRYRYEGESRLPADTVIYLQVRDASCETWYVRSDPLVPAPGEWSLNTTEAAGWTRTFCDDFGTSASCMGRTETEAVFAEGICVTGFAVQRY